MKGRHRPRPVPSGGTGRACAKSASRSPSSVCAANFPSATITTGLMRAICACRNGEHCSISSGSGLRLSGGRHFTTFAMYTCSRARPIALMICVSNCPARPTNGSPFQSSSAPGPSPMNISRACGSPTPKTMLRAPLVQLAACAVADFVADFPQFEDLASARPDWHGRPGLDRRFDWGPRPRLSPTSALPVTPRGVLEIPSTPRSR